MADEKLAAFLKTLDWTAPYVDLYDAVYEFLNDLDRDRRDAMTHEDLVREIEDRGDDYYDGKADDDRAARAERIVMARLK